MPHQAKAVLAEMVAAGGDGDPAAIAAAKGFEAMATGALEAAVDAAIAADPVAWEKFVGGDDKVAGAFVGPVMKATKGKADGKAVNSSDDLRSAIQSKKPGDHLSLVVNRGGTEHTIDVTVGSRNESVNACGQVGNDSAHKSSVPIHQSVVTALVKQNWLHA